MSQRDHIEAVNKWLKANVKTYDNPKIITIDEIEFDPSQFTGSFSLSLDETKLEDRFEISLGIDGLMSWHGPIFTSPLGAPASYSAIELSDGTCVAIKNALNQLFPKMAAFGLHPKTGKFINSSTPLNERILDAEGLKKIIASIDNGSATIKIDCLRET